MSGKVPFVDLVAWHAPSRQEYLDAFAKIIDAGAYVGGPQVGEFEAAFAKYCGAAHAIAVKTGTDALVLALRALGIAAGDEVIAPANSFFATAEAISLVGATPVLCDVDDATLLIDLDDAARRITPRTKCIVPVHLFGQVADIDRVRALGVPVLEDAAQAHGSTRGGHRAGSCGLAAAFSFYPTKNLGALGDGGMVVTGDRQLADRVRRLRNGGQRGRYEHEEPGVYSRLDEMQASFLRARLPFLAGWTARRRALAASYRARLAHASLVVPPERDAGHVYHLFVVRSSRRQALQNHLRERGVETLVHYPTAIPCMPAFASTNPTPCPRAIRAASEVLSLPLYPALSDEALIEAAAAVTDFDRKD